MFPNPTTDMIIVTNLDYGMEAQVLNSVGQNVTKSVKQETNRTDGQMVIDMSDLPNGLYHFVANNKSTIVKKR